MLKLVMHGIKVQSILRGHIEQIGDIPRDRNFFWLMVSEREVLIVTTSGTNQTRNIMGLLEKEEIY